MRYQAIAIGIAIALLVGIGFLFRARIFRLPLPDNMPRDNLGTQQRTAPEAASSPANRAQNHSTSTPLSAGIYRGRPLDEIRFSSEWLQSASAHQKSQFSVDIKKYANMAQETPEYIAAWLQLALLKNAIGDYEGSRDIWVYVTIVRPREATAFLNLGNLYTNNLKNYPRAEANYRGAIKADPNVAMGYLGLSDLYIYFSKEKESQADQVLLQGIAVNPKDVNLHKALARLYERRQNYAAARSTWERVRALDPGNTSVEEKIEELKGK